MHLLYRYILLLPLLTGQLLVYTAPVITHLGIQQGLSNNSVRCIFQDHTGLMWFGTYDGLNSYDGYGFRIFRNTINDTTSIPHNYIYTIHEDKLNNLWIGTGQGAAIYNRVFDRFTPVYYEGNVSGNRYKITCNVNTIRSDEKGNVFIGTNGWGLFYKQAVNTNARQIPLRRANGETLWYNVQTICVDSRQQVWLFIDGVGLCLFSCKDKAIQLVNNVLKSASSLEADGNGHLWIGTEEGLYQYNTGSNSFVQHYTEGKAGLTANAVASLCTDAQHNLWIGTTGGGVNILNTNTGVFDYLLPGEASGRLSSESVYAIWCDQEARMWMGTLKGGIDIMDAHKSRFQTIAHSQGNSNSPVNNFIAAFYEDANGHLWIGTDGGGMSIWNRRNNQFTHFTHAVTNNRSLSNNSVSCIKQDYTGHTWVATYGGGINLFNPATGSFSQYKCINPATGQENKNVCLLYEDRDSSLWATTFGNGKLYRLNRQQQRFDLFAADLNDLIAIREDHTGALWAGNSHQLIRIDKKNKRHVYYEMSKPVRAIYEDRRNNLWIGTEGGGLLLFDRAKGKVAQRYSTGNGLTNNAVLTILEDAAGNIWMSTFNGLSKFDPHKQTFQNFYQSDGLQSNQFSYNAALRLTTGELVVGGINGFNLFYPEQIAARHFMPPVLFTGIWVNNKPLSDVTQYILNAGSDSITELRIPYKEAILSFHFTALEYSSPEKIAYAYYMQGWDKGWNYTGSVKTINYNNIGEGSYVLKVRSTNAAGVWSNRETSIQITILPPWYRSWWAYAAYLIIVTSLVYVYFSYRARQRRLEYEIHLAELNASFFTNISHEFRTPLTLIINPIKDLLRQSPEATEERDLNVVYRNARRLLSLVDQLLIFRKADTKAGKMQFAALNFYTLCQEVYLCFVQQAKSNHLTYVFECSNEQLQLYVDREKMEIVLYNLISNAIKFTPPGGTIIFKVEETTDAVQVSVKDTGCGIPAVAREKLFDKFYQAPAPTGKKPGFGIGLYLVKHFITAHKGTVAVESSENVGTTFTVALHKGSNHLPAELIVKEAAQEPLFLEELLEEPEETPAVGDNNQSQELVTSRARVLVVDDEPAIRHYLQQMLQDKYEVLEAVNGEEGLQKVQQQLPDLVISDIRMDAMDGIELCRKIKKEAALNHIPVILLTGSTTTHTELESIEEGADLYVTKPFDKAVLLAKVENIFKTRTDLRHYFFNEITLKQNTLKVSAEYRDFLQNCIAIVELHLTDEQFSIKVLAKEIGMSHSNLYKKIRLLSGQSITNFIRYIRLRKAAELMLNHDYNVNQAAFEVGISDPKYFRTHFHKLFGMNPSEYIKKYRNVFAGQYHVKKGGT